MLKYMHSKKGFTLIELMIVVAIIGILAAIAIPQYIKYIKRSRTTTGVDHAKVICEGLVDWYSDPNQGAGTVAIPTAATLGNDKVAFLVHHPSESDLMTNGDTYHLPYGPLITLVSGEPQVIGTQKIGGQTYGVTVQAGGAFGANSLTGCRGMVTAVDPLY